MIGYRHALAQQARARSAEQVDGLALFDFPVRPPAANEPISLPLDGTIEGGYHLWRETVDGAEVFAWIEAVALGMLAAGDSVIGVKDLTERARKTLHRHVNNSHTSLLARELVARHPALRAVIQLRERSAT